MGPKEAHQVWASFTPPHPVLTLTDIGLAGRHGLGPETANTKHLRQQELYLHYPPGASECVFMNLQQRQPIALAACLWIVY